MLRLVELCRRAELPSPVWTCERVPEPRAFRNPTIDINATGTVFVRVNAEDDSVMRLSREMVERLEKAQPDTLAAAGRIAGITPAALASLLVHARRRIPA